MFSQLEINVLVSMNRTLHYILAQVTYSGDNGGGLFAPQWPTHPKAVSPHPRMAPPIVIYARLIHGFLLPRNPYLILRYCICIVLYILLIYMKGKRGKFAKIRYQQLPCSRIISSGPLSDVKITRVFLAIFADLTADKISPTISSISRMQSPNTEARNNYFEIR